MCSYNRVKGVNASDNRWLLTDVLRTKFGFTGLVMSDWGAVNDRLLGVSAGLDLEMPYIGPYHDHQIERAVAAGTLREEDVDRCAARVVALVERAKAREPVPYDANAHHLLARSAAAQSAVLLKNEDRLLPLKSGASVAVLGALAKEPRYQGAGSSKVQPLTIESPYEELLKLGVNAAFAEGYRAGGGCTGRGADSGGLRSRARQGRGARLRGSAGSYESEGFDRESLAMPLNQTELIRRVYAVNPNVAVILACGSVVDLDWEASAKSILLMYLGGEAVGGAVADLVTGAVCPGGKLAESWPVHLSDTPCHAYFPGYTRTVEYRESIFVGYRYYDTAQKAVRYPFGYGLSYTSFSYSNLQLSSTQLDPNETLTVSFDVTNTGDVAGAEVAQLYVSHRSGVMFTPEQELKGFEKIFSRPAKQNLFHLRSRGVICAK
jgi:beta-glucosidase